MCALFSPKILQAGAGKGLICQPDVGFASQGVLTEENNLVKRNHRQYFSFDFKGTSPLETGQAKYFKINEFTLNC